MNTRPEQLRDIPEGVQATHWPACWREHKACAVARVELAEARVAEVDRALIACQEEIADLRQRIRDERREHEHTQLNRAGASAQADGLARALIACQERCSRLAEALQDELRDATAEIERLCGAMPRERFDYYVEHSRRVQRIRDALAEHDAAKGEG